MPPNKYNNGVEYFYVFIEPDPVFSIPLLQPHLFWLYLFSFPLSTGTLKARRVYWSYLGRFYV